MNRLFKSAMTLMLAVSSLAFVSCDDDEPNIIGLNDAAKYGNIKVTLSGTRPDGEEFTASKNFRFLSEDGLYASEVDYNSGYYTEFNVQRWLGAVDDYYNYNYADLYLEVDPVTDEIDDVEFYMTTSIINSDKTYFDIDNSFNPTMEDITEYSFNPDNGKLKLKFTTVSADNDTGHELTVTVEVNVTVFENIGNEVESE